MCLCILYRRQAARGNGSVNNGDLQKKASPLGALRYQSPCKWVFAVSNKLCNSTFENGHMLSQHPIDEKQKSNGIRPPVLYACSVISSIRSAHSARQQQGSGKVELAIGTSKTAWHGDYCLGRCHDSQRKRHM